ncbi:MAG: hypothetical protein LBS87_01340 [Puniceicoccales bacterium]|jgi:hypothetical protein|nr:hypothetical protein [Puniceicoccales bacterium]
MESNGSSFTGDLPQIDPGSVHFMGENANITPNVTDEINWEQLQAEGGDMGGQSLSERVSAILNKICESAGVLFGACKELVQRATAPVLVSALLACVLDKDEAATKSLLDKVGLGEKITPYYQNDNTIHCRCFSKWKWDGHFVHCFYLLNT